MSPHPLGPSWQHLDAATREMRLYEDDSPHAAAAERCRRRLGEASG